MNVDDSGRRLCPGQLEVNDSDLILYQAGKSAVRWPLRSLRRYGFDAELFSFECGRRCPTGPGIYAFHCRRAQLLFNNVQARVAARHGQAQTQQDPQQQQQQQHSSRSRVRHSSVLSPSSLMMTSQNNDINMMAEEDGDEEGSYLEPIRLQGPAGLPMWSPHSRPLSASSLISSGSSAIVSPSTGHLVSVIHANNNVLSSVAHSDALSSDLVAAADPSTNAAAATENVLPPPIAYANCSADTLAELQHHYMNNKIDQLLRDDDDDSQQHLYINVGPSDSTEVIFKLTTDTIGLIS